MENKDLERLEKKIQDNAKKLDKHLEMIQKNSYALDILKDYKAGSKRAFTLAILFAIAWLITLGTLITIIIIHAI